MQSERMDDPFQHVDGTEEIIIELPGMDTDELFDRLTEVFYEEGEEPTEAVQQVIDEINDRISNGRIDTQEHQELKQRLPEELQDFIS